MAFKRRSVFILPLIILLCSILGGIYGPQVQVAVAASDAEESGLGRQIESFTKIYSLVDQNFAESLNADKAIYKGAIPGMLQTLDPHSNFVDPREYRLLRDDQRGHYFGVGMTVSPRNGKTVIIAPFPGSPAWVAGLRPGDIIVAVNDKSTEGLSSTEVVDLLKGPRNTQVKIAVSREGAPDHVSFTVTRDQINRKSVPDAFWIKPGIAYMKLLTFGENTSREMNENLARLGEASLKGLVLDLRGNGGGLLDQAVAVADHFLPKGAVIVSHRGRASAERIYTARNGNRGRDYPIVVLVNRGSASASEIVSGALQDHDRAWILGETTFGKGLVQTIFPLSESTALLLTTAHFYTASGRLIQRDYSHQSFFDYYFHRDQNSRNTRDVKMTDSGRTVYGGGGITPDEKYEAPKVDSLEVQLFRDGLFNFSRTYFVNHKAALPKGWMPDNAVLAELHDYLQTNKYTFTEAQFSTDHDWILRYLAREMYVYAFNVDESDRVFAMSDPEVERAVEALPKASALVQTAKRTIAQRTAR